MGKPKVSFIPCGVHTEVTDSFGRPFIDYTMINKATNSLKKAGFEVYEFKDFVRVKSDSIRAFKDTEKEDVDCIILYIATWLWASEIVGAAKLTSKPIIIWTPPISQGWATGGAMVLHGTFDEVGLKHKFVYGFPDEIATIHKIKAYVNASKVIRKLKGSTVGLIGGMSMGAFTGRVDEATWIEKFGVNIDHMDQYVLVNKAQKILKEEIKKKYNELKNLIGTDFPLSKIMERSIRLYLAMKEIINEKEYDFTALKCFPEIGDNYATGCLAQSLLGTEGFVSACIGDLNTALTGYILNILTDSAIFSPDIQQVRIKEGVIKLTSDGACPLSLASSFEEVKLSNRGIFGEGEADGICVGFVCKPGPVTLARMMRIKGKYCLHISLGEAFVPPTEVLENELNECGFPYWPHAFIKLDGDPESFIQNQRSEYISMCYGHVKEELLDFCYLLDIEPILTN